MRTKYALGVHREFLADELRPEEQQWIRYIGYFDDTSDEHFFIVCCTHAQALEFQKVRAIEMDLSFKAVVGNMNLFSLVGWNEDTMSACLVCIEYTEILTSLGIDVYAYVWMTTDTRKAYKQMFTELFRVLGDVARSPVQFAHIHHGNGLRTISCDMCKKQAGGTFRTQYALSTH